MKKVLSVLVIMAILFSLSACGKKGNEDNSTGSEQTAPRDNERIQDTRIDAVWSALRSDVYAIDINLAGTKMSVYRNGNDIRTDMAGMETLVVDGLSYDFDGMKALYTEIPQSSIDVIIEDNAGYKILETVVELEGAELIGTGNETFGTQEGLYYEEIKTAGKGERVSALVKVFFDGDDMKGIKLLNVDGVETEVSIFVSANAPDSLFEIDEEYEIAPKPEESH